MRVLVLLDETTNEEVYRYVTAANEESIGEEVVSGRYRLLLSIEADAIGGFVDRREGVDRRQG